ncbi:type II toxin-antitoxin system VapC family toxin [Brevundimonas sp.]
MEPRGQLPLTIHLDTNVLLWLSRRRQTSLGNQARRLARLHDWAISPAVILELEILHEIGRIKVSVDRVLASASEVGDLSISQTPYPEVVQAARGLSWTRDPMDRLIVAHAMNDDARLLTADGRILANFKDAVWD